jgi:hypothetical protein
MLFDTFFHNLKVQLFIYILIINYVHLYEHIQYLNYLSFINR